MSIMAGGVTILAGIWAGRKMVSNLRAGCSLELLARSCACTAPRIHSTTGRPWGYDEEVFKVTRDAMQLRHALIPYLYSMAWRFHTQSVPPILPMYYDFPEEKAAYACPDQYMYGDKLLVAPFIAPKEEQTQLSRKAVWLPKGGWYGFYDGVYYPEGWYACYGKLSEIPVFARAGAIVPLGQEGRLGRIE